MFGYLFGRGRRGYRPAPMFESEELKSGISTPSSRSSSEVEEDMPVLMIATRRPERSRRSTKLLMLHMLLVVINVLVVSTVFGVRSIPWRHERNYQLRAVSEHSPLFDHMDVEMRTVQFDGSVYNNANSSIFRRPPSDEVDEAWLEISAVKMFLADRVDIVKAGLDPNVAVRVPSSWNEGEKYVVQLDGPHQLHCLDLLRRQAYARHYYPDGNDRDAFYWAHMSHCLDSLRQALMCTSSLNILPLQYVEGVGDPTFDFNSKHKCRNHYAVLDWIEDHAIDWTGKEPVSMPKGYVPVPAEEESYDYIPAYSEVGRAKIKHQLQTGGQHHHHHH